MKLSIFLVSLLLVSPVFAQVVQVPVPAHTVTVTEAAQAVPVPAKKFTAADGSSITVPAYSVTLAAHPVSGTEAAFTVPYTPVITPPPPPPAAPTVSLTAVPTSITAGATAALTWNSANATSCSGVGSGLSGSLTVAPAVSTSYTETCLGTGGMGSASASVAVTPVVTPPPPPPPTGNGGNVLGGPVVFSYTFDAPAGLSGTRTGDLDPNVWGVSRTLGAGVNLGQGQYGLWNSVARLNCDGTTTEVVSPADVFICNGQLREAVNDNNSLQFDAGDVTSLAIYPKQPFDFANRTGTVSFDVSNDSYGIHDAWPEFWMSDAPVPDPFTHQSSWHALPANGFGIRMANAVTAGMQGECPNGNNLGSPRWTVDSADIVRGYASEDVSANNGPTFGTLTGLKVTPLDCVISSTGPGNMNHVEIRVSQSTIDVYATDAGVAATTTTLRHIATVTGANLSFTRGLVWMEDAHYNADKQTSLTGQTVSHRQHTFSWDNLAFDGPFTDRDFTFDAPDVLTPVSGGVNLGKISTPSAPSVWSIPNVPANMSIASAAKLLFDFASGGNAPPTVLNISINGHALPATPWVAPQNAQTTVPTPAWATYAVVIPLTDLVPGTNTVSLGTDAALAFANVDIVLAAVTGGVPVLPGSVQTYP